MSEVSNEWMSSEMKGAFMRVSYHGPRSNTSYDCEDNSDKECKQ